MDKKQPEKNHGEMNADLLLFGEKKKETDEYRLNLR